MLDLFILTYNNTAEINDQIYNEFTKKTNDHLFLKEHRDYIEANNLGFGERAFHFMWLLLINEIAEKNLNKNILEIGVFKGQVISLWALLGRHLNIDLNITGITPLEGNPPAKSSILRSLLFRISKKYRKDVLSGNLYKDEDYRNIIKGVFDNFGLNLAAVQIIKGFSTDADVLATVAKNQYAIIYVDGDHTFEGVTADIINYSPLVQKGGFLVMDDAACNIPGTAYWKGHKSVSDACEIIEDSGFINIINVGHNRVYKKI
jgi:hypothetical protein